jgi:outer membrane receptor protein involved in Fe transport
MASHAGILDLNHIHHIEVITGPGSAELGAGPLTGVINIVTEDFLDSNGTAIEINENYGTGKFNDFSVLMNYRQDKIKFRISLAAFEQPDGYKPLTGNKQWVIPDGVIQDNKYFEHLPGMTIFLNGIYADWNLSLFSTKTQRDPYVVGSQVVQVYETQGGKIERMINFNHRWKLNAMAHLNRVGLQERFHLKEPGQVAHTGETSYGSKVTCQFNTRRIKLSFGGDFQYYQYGENPFTRQNIYQTRGYPELANQDLSEIIEPGNVPDYSQFHANVKALNTGFFGELYLQLNSVHGLLISSRYSNVDLYNESRF